MIMNTNTNRIFEHLNIFSIDYYIKQQHQQHYNEIDINITSDQHDKNFQSNIKDEKNDSYVDNHLITSSNSTDNIEQPLLIVLDEDDIQSDDEHEQINVITTNINAKDNLSNNHEYEINLSNKKSLTDRQILNKSKTSFKYSKLSRHTRKSHLNPLINDHNRQISNKFFQTFFIDTDFMRQTHYQQNRNRLISRRKNSHKYLSSPTMSNNINSKNLTINENSQNLSSTDSILSNISFDNISNILTVSRMGSIFYCLEDLYTKVFSSLCTLDEFINLLLKSELIIIKQVTLSEKISIEQQMPSLKKFHDSRYRLISINSSDYLLKLKQLLLTSTNLNENECQQREKYINQIIDEMRSYRRTPTPVLLKDKVSHSPMATKRLSSDDDDDDDDDEEHDAEPRKRLKIVTKKPKSNETPPLAPTQFGIFIQCNGPVSCNIFSTNETVSSTTTTATAATASAETTATAATSTTTIATSESEIISKSTIIKKQNENTHMYFDKFHQQYQNISRFNLINEQSIQKSTNLNRINSQNPTDDTHINKQCSSSSSSSSLSSVMNMPKKWRILNSYNNDIHDTSSTTKIHIPTLSTNHSRCLYRSKSFTYNKQLNKNHLRRSSSLTLITSYKKENFLTIKKFLTRNNNTKLNTKSTTAEPIDLTDESYSMPMIVNVEENVELANQRHKIKNRERRTPPTIVSRSISHIPNPSILTKPTPIHHPIPSSSYRTSPYDVYHQNSYTYRDPSSSASIPHSYYHPTTHLNNGNLYSYPFSSSIQYPTMKKSKELPITTCYDIQSNSVTLPSSSSLSNHNNNNNNNNNNNTNNYNNNLSSSVVMPIVRKPNYYHQLTPEQQASIKMQTSSISCRLPCCFPSSAIQSQHSTDKLTPNERLIYRQYTIPPSTTQTLKRDPSQTPDIQHSSPTINRKQRRIDSIPTTSTTPYLPYPSPKSYFVPPAPPSSAFSSSSSHWPSTSPSITTANPNINPSMRYPYPPPPNTPMNGMALRKTEPYPPPRRPIPIQSRVPSTTPIVAQNSSILISPPNTPHELTLPNIRARSIDLQRAIIERGYCDMDKLPKLVVRHTKIYTNKTIDTMGQLFPTWFNEPDYRCIHCFRCDQVFTPQQFMTHVDDEHMQNEQPLNMTSIQLLTSEKMSEYKVGLWNQFCTNLTTYARDGRIGGFSTNRSI
ncbi:unnamed protein product [Rotaria sordida]|uniref:c-SKI SMAD4-binding domain-containing protein n=1 Tax=Rotaria sordida TaxID=392033 RepID=A0A814ILJ2_9BILA|nr:unnamed protein product [Rotaria sordida]CAF1023192.1 unnamed protein product [Rotaria sordida]